VPRQLSFNCLLVMIRDEKLPSKLRAAATHLITCLYVDRSPQRASRTPRLTRVGHALLVLLV
jgi:hypothetical protein